MGVFYFVKYLSHMKYIISENQYNLLFKELIAESMGRNELVYQQFSKLADMMKKYIAGKHYDFEITSSLEYDMSLPVMSLEEFEKVFKPYFESQKITRETHPNYYKTQYTPEGYPLPLKVPTHTKPISIDIESTERGIYTHKFDGNGNLVTIKISYWDETNGIWKVLLVELNKPFDFFSYFLNKRKYDDGYENLILLGTQYGTNPFGVEIGSFANNLDKFYHDTKNTGDELSRNDITGRDDLGDLDNKSWKNCWDEDFEDEDGKIRTIKRCEYKLPNSKRIKSAAYIINESGEQDYAKRVYSSVLGYIDANSDKIRFNQDNVKNLQSKGNIMRYCEFMRDGKIPITKLSPEEMKVLKSIMNTLKTIDINLLNDYVERGQNIKHKI